MIARQSMRMQTTAIIIAAFLLSHVAGYIIYTLDRRDALEMTEAIDFADRAAGVSRLVRDFPKSEQAQIVAFSDSRAFRTWISDSAAVPPGTPTDEEADVVAYLRSQVPRIAANDMRVRLLDDPLQIAAPPHNTGASRPGPPVTLPEPEPGPSIGISIQHAEGEWMNFVGSVTTPRSLLPELLFINLFSAVVGISLVAFWLVGRVTRPLADFASAAEGLGRDLNRAPLAVAGPREVAVAAEALNGMQRQLVRLVQGRTELLAAISHDLRTPLTQLRLRLELMAPSSEQQKALQSIDDMDQTIGTFLAYARAAHDSEPASRIDLGALVGSICDDLADCGAPVTCDVTQGLVVRCKRLAIKRALVNLIDNALKYGDRAGVTVARRAGGAAIIIEDDGPGIPDDELALVLKPFYRARTIAKGSQRKPGTGLGLSIAQAILEDQGGTLRLCNRPGGGLRAEVLLGDTPGAGA